MTIVDYKIIAAVDTGYLQRAVVKELKFGWQPLGGVAYEPTHKTYL